MRNVVVMQDWINRLIAIRQRTFEFNKTITFKKFKRDDRILSTLEPNKDDLVDLAAIANDYQDITDEIFAFLDTYPKLKMRFSNIEENVVSYILFERIGGDLVEEAWREQFIVEFTGVIARLTTFIEELMEIYTKIKFKCFKTAEPCSVPIRRNSSAAFVIMPFDKKYNDIYRYGIRETLEQMGIVCRRADEITHRHDIMCRGVCKPLQEADFVIADMTLKNANVFFELGLSYGFEKEVLLIAQNLDDIPFDLRGMNSVIYGGEIGVLREELPKKLQEYANA
ncbi:MAG: hypothetical protein FWH55_11390 [Oscillospiraceae bacterium]|nr:hypothetical protein [Oscillospiraceae bacterium]